MSDVTPVEERIDHERLAQLFDEGDEDGNMSPFHIAVENEWPKILALLTEHSALRKAFQDEVTKMEAEHSAREETLRRFCEWVARKNATSTWDLAMKREIVQRAEAVLALPATEPAQPEEKR